MQLYPTLTYPMLQALSTAIGAAGSVTFFTTGGFPTTALCDTNKRILLSSTPIASYSTTGGTYTRATAVFGAMTTGTVNATGNVSYFALLSTNTGAVDSTDGGNVILTGTVTSGTTGDLIFNVTSWDLNDNVSITSLTFSQPR